VGSAEGVRKVAAKRLGLSLEQYNARIAAGEKWCGRCRAWHPVAAFSADSSRGDGLASICPASRVVGKDRPGVRERRIRRASGQAWCGDCKVWLPVDQVNRQGRCQPHASAQGRAYYAAHADIIRPRKLARTRGLDPTPDWWRKERYAEFGGLCAYACGRNANTLDHVWPVARGGQSEPSNLVPACRSCNSTKKAAAPGPWLERFAAAFPGQFADLAALTFEHASSLDMDGVA
jgi:5-methylcytosine-specific restriction endonuclease McrA